MIRVEWNLVQRRLGGRRFPHHTSDDVEERVTGITFGFQHDRKGTDRKAFSHLGGDYVALRTALRFLL